ncbi:zinc-binding dehydrogenase [Paenibacillus senegalensis]|uniref:zinc-binding dehydrogenase n=1 Tax=Paenibacillus senegalensis TaxID=1465766 RepID=UPI00028A2FE5|nr:zinc-binding dehydrogenase [Paenibacillus senegalensis]
METKSVNTAVQSRVYRLTKPREMEEITVERIIPEGFVAIEPTMASICHADLRYFTGMRRPEALAKKLPMALLHEGIGTIVESRDASRQPGQRAVIVPNIPGRLLNPGQGVNELPPFRAGWEDNYSSHGAFLGSGNDGIAQDRLVIPAACAIPIPDHIPDEIAVLSELCSVSTQALSRVENELKAATVAVFGDGPVGYLTAAMVHHLHGLDESRLRVFGADEAKLSQVEFASRAMVQDYDFANAEKVDIAIECTGGRFSESAANQAIDILKPGGILILMGVTEERVPINTRDVLEKGLTLFGSSRSSINDYYPVLEAMTDPACQATLRKLLPDEHKSILRLNDFVEVMEEASNHRDWKKTILEFKW